MLTCLKKEWKYKEKWWCITVGNGKAEVAGWDWSRSAETGCQKLDGINMALGRIFTCHEGGEGSQRTVVPKKQNEWLTGQDLKLNYSVCVCVCVFWGKDVSDLLEHEQVKKNCAAVVWIIWRSSVFITKYCTVMI